jgi:hypothetical protein
MLQWVAVPQGRGPPTGDGRSRIMEEGRVSTSSYTCSTQQHTYLCTAAVRHALRLKDVVTPYLVICPTAPAGIGSSTL